MIVSDGVGRTRTMKQRPSRGWVERAERPAQFEACLSTLTLSLQTVPAPLREVAHGGTRALRACMRKERQRERLRRWRGADAVLCASPHPPLLSPSSLHDALISRSTSMMTRTRPGTSIDVKRSARVPLWNRLLRWPAALLRSRVRSGCPAQRFAGHVPWRSPHNALRRRQPNAR